VAHLEGKELETVRRIRDEVSIELRVSSILKPKYQIDDIKRKLNEIFVKETGDIMDEWLVVKKTKEEVREMYLEIKSSMKKKV